MPRKRPASRAPVPAVATLRAFFAFPLVQELRSLGVPEGFLRKHGFPARTQGARYRKVPLRQFVALIENAAGQLGRPFLGLEMGQKFTLGDLGPFYAMLTLSQHLRGSLEKLVQFFSAWQTLTSLDLVPARGGSALRYRIQDPTIWPRSQDAEFAMASLCALTRQLISTRWRPLEVQFEHDIKGREDRLNRYFRCGVSGGCGANQLLLANADLNRSLRWRMGPHDAAVLAILEGHLLELLGVEPNEADESYSRRVSAQIGRQLADGRPNFPAIAAELGVAVRTLHRRLKDEGTSYRMLLRQERQNRADQLLGNRSVRLSKLADRMGYSDAAVLSRAFKNWTGLSPREYRRRARSS